MVSITAIKYVKQNEEEKSADFFFQFHFKLISFVYISVRDWSICFQVFESLVASGVRLSNNSAQLVSDIDGKENEEASITSSNPPHPG